MPLQEPEHGGVDQIGLQVILRPGAGLAELSAVAEDVEEGEAVGGGADTGLADERCFVADALVREQAREGPQVGARHRGLVWLGEGAQRGKESVIFRNGSVSRS